jgi:hypothetical protein
MGKKPTRCDLCEFLLFYAVIFGSPSSKIKIFASKGNEYHNQIMALKHVNYVLQQALRNTNIENFIAPQTACYS